MARNTMGLPSAAESAARSARSLPTARNTYLARRKLAIVFFVAFEIRRLDVIERKVAALLISEFGHAPAEVVIERGVAGLHDCDAGWQWRRQARPHARTRKDIIDSHSKFSIAWGLSRPQPNSGLSPRPAGHAAVGQACCKPSARRRRRVLIASGAHNAGSAMFGMRRRQVIALIGVAAASMAWPPALRAQQPTMLRVCFVGVGIDPEIGAGVTSLARRLNTRTPSSSPPFSSICANRK